MSLSVHCLASGSSGNCILVRDGSSSVLIDAGIGIRRIVAGLVAARMNPADVSAILITHEHSDHVSGAVRMANRFQVPLVANARTLARIRDADRVPSGVLDVGAEMSIGRLSVRSFPVSHDAACPVGYTVTCGGTTVCSATDTGALTPRIRAEAERADLLILESNHDLDMLKTGPYPSFLKQRILSSRGHLSNETSALFLREIADSGRKAAVWLAHLSLTNNTPSIALDTARKSLASCVGTPLAVDVAKRDVPSLHWSRENTTFQLGLFGWRL